MMNQFFARFQNIEGMNARSNVLVSLLWLFFLTLTATISASIWIKNEVILYFMLSFLSIEIVAIIFAYFFFAIKNPDCLRSETFTLSKLAIEKGQIGDNSQGIEQRNEPQSDQPPVIIEVRND